MRQLSARLAPPVISVERIADELRRMLESERPQLALELLEAGGLLDNDNGTFLVLQKGIVQRHELKERDPAMVVFDRYAFDLSQFAGGSQAVKYSIRERYLWQLLFPDPKDPFYIEQPGQFRAELHDLVADEEQVVGLHTGTGQRNGQTLRLHIALVFHLRAGKVSEAWEHAEDTQTWDEFFA